ncbi:MAG: hypothetical protein KDJ88_01570, partial [Bauldia sp.]|nr:hypothetical protein [Bauldia sp.]
EGGGSGDVPPVTLDWYNLKTGAVERAEVEGFAVAIDGPPLRKTEPRDWRAITITAIVGLVALAVVVWLLRRLIPPLLRFAHERREAWLASETRAYRQLRRAVGRRDYAALFPALDTWAGKVTGPDPRKDPRLVEALTRLGATRYGTAEASASAAPWKTLADTLADARRASREPAIGAGALPPLNPSTRGR